MIVFNSIVVALKSYDWRRKREAAQQDHRRSYAIDPNHFVPEKTCEPVEEDLLVAVLPKLPYKGLSSEAI
jgi:hypothetical protein